MTKSIFLNTIWLIKNAEFDADFKYVEKVAKNPIKKLLMKK
jgi:hypothetical protein